MYATGTGPDWYLVPVYRCTVQPHCLSMCYSAIPLTHLPVRHWDVWEEYAASGTRAIDGRTAHITFRYTLQQETDVCGACQ